MDIIRFYSIIILLSSPLILCSQTFIADPNDNTAFVEYHDGKQWVYRNIEGLTVGMTNEEYHDDYGKYYQIKIFINNNRDSTFTFNPDKVFAKLLSNKGDTISLEVYTNDEYQKKIKNAQAWAMALYGLSAGLNAASANISARHSKAFSPYPFNRTHNTNTSYQTNLTTSLEIKTLGELMKKDKAVREDGYLKLNTIHPNDAIVGFMNVKHKKGKQLIVTIHVGETIFSYLWDIEKKKTSKK